MYINYINQQEKTKMSLSIFIIHYLLFSSKFHFFLHLFVSNLRDELNGNVSPAEYLLLCLILLTFQSYCKPWGLLAFSKSYC